MIFYSNFTKIRVKYVCYAVKQTSCKQQNKSSINEKTHN